jgi:hypothetical protein
MATERIDIEVTDKVSPQPAKKLREIASEALRADSALDSLKASVAALDASPLVRLATASAKLTSAQARETSATARLINARSKMNTETSRAAAAAARLATEHARTEAATERAAAASSRARSALLAEESASIRLAAAKRREAAAQGLATGAAGRASIASLTAAKSAGLAAHQTQNLIFQVNDVVVGLASGQKPLTVLLQQGSQISTVFGPGTGVIRIMKGVGSAVFSIAKQFAPVIVAVGILASGFAILKKEVISATDPAEFIGLQAEVDKLTKKQREGIVVGVTFGDVMKASMQLAGESIYKFIKPAIDAIAPWFTSAYNWIIFTTKSTINNVIRGFRLIGETVAVVMMVIPTLFDQGFEKAKSFVFWAMHDILAAVTSMVNGVASAFNETFGTQLVPTGLYDIMGELNRKGNEAAVAAEKSGKAMNAAWSEFGSTVDKIMATDYAGGAFNAIQERSVELARKRITAELENERATGAGNAKLSVKQKLLSGIIKPLIDYRENTAALNELLSEGVITLGQYNEALASLSLAKSLRDLDASLEGTPFADEAMLEEVRIAEQERLNIVQQALEARIISEQEAADRIVAISRQSAVDINNIEAARNSMILNAAESTFSSLADAAKGFAGEQSGIYKAMFITSKAFAIADSIIKIQQGIANAISLPFPANIAAVATVAAAAANIVSSITAVQFKKDGGEIFGQGGPRDDKVPVMASPGEFIINARDTARNKPLLHAINAGHDVVGRAPVFRTGGEVQPAYRAPVTRSDAPSVGNDRRQVSGGININITTPDVQGFLASESQVAAATARAVNRGQRNL